MAIYKIQHTATFDGETDTFTGRRWNTDEESARRYFARETAPGAEIFSGETLALVGPTGLILDTYTAD